MSDDEGKRGMGARSHSAMCSSPTSKKALQLKEQNSDGCDSREQSLTHIPKEALLDNEEEEEEEDEAITVTPLDSMKHGSGTTSPNEEGMGARSRSVPAMTLTSDDKEDCTLEHEWTIWFDKSARKIKTKGKGDKKGEDTMYEDCIVELGTFSTVEVFWTYWNSLHVHNLKDHCNLRVFKKGIKPLWEDKMNKKGGKWVVRGVPKTHRKKLWTNMIMHLIKGKLKDNTTHTVCGVVLSTRDNGDSMQLWQDGGLTLQTTPETPEQTAERTGRPTTEDMLQELLTVAETDEVYSNFKYQTHAELQQTGPPAQGQKEKPSYHAARDTLDPANASAMAMAALSGVANAAQEEKPKEVPLAEKPQQAGDANPFGILPGMLLPEMGDTSGVPNAMMGMMHAMENMQGMMGSMGAYGALPGANVGAIDDSWAKEAGEEDQSDSDDGMQNLHVEGQAEPTHAVRQIQERAKLIRTVRKKIRYINFFLARQGKGRELTLQEKQRVKSMPFLQRELQLLEEQQTKEVEDQKKQLGVDSLDFLRKPQQPMTYVNESEKRFKTMRAIRKKIRFIHYHLERQRQGKVLSPAEIAKVNALPEFEKKLAELENDEALANGGTVLVHDANSEDAQDATVLPMKPVIPSAQPSTTSTPVLQNAPAFPTGSFSAPPSENPDAMTSLFPQNSQPTQPQQPTGMPQPKQQYIQPNQPQGAQGMHSWIEQGMQAAYPATGQALPSYFMPQGGAAPQAGDAGAANAFGGFGVQHPSQILELRQQIEAQKKELEEKQRHIDMLVKQGIPPGQIPQITAGLPMGNAAAMSFMAQTGNMGMGVPHAAVPVNNGSFNLSANTAGANPVSPGSLYLSPGPPPLESPSAAGTLGQGGPMSPVGGLPPNRILQQQQQLQQQPQQPGHFPHMTQFLGAQDQQSI